MTLGQIYNLLVEKNGETGKQNAWVDAETNTIWTLGGEKELFRFSSDNVNLKEMTEQEISELIAVINALADDEEST